MLTTRFENQYEFILWANVQKERKKDNAYHKVGVNERLFSLDKSGKFVCKPKVNFQSMEEGQGSHSKWVLFEKSHVAHIHWLNINVNGPKDNNQLFLI